MSNTHTPGPWRVDIGQHAIGDTGDFESYCTVKGPAKPIAYISNPDDDSADVDAALIAAAPDMLETLKAIQHWMADARIPCCFPVDAVHEAIKKAEGRSS